MFLKGHTFKRLSNRLFIEKRKEANLCPGYQDTSSCKYCTYTPSKVHSMTKQRVTNILVVSIKYVVLVSVLASIFMRFFLNQNDRLHGFLCVSRCRKLLLSHYTTALFNRNVSEYVPSITNFVLHL